MLTVLCIPDIAQVKNWQRKTVLKNWNKIFSIYKMQQAISKFDGGAGGA